MRTCIKDGNQNDYDSNLVRIIGIMYVSCYEL